MPYELAKQLKDAGFPQPHHNEQCTKNDCYMLPCPNSRPTLEELIEACGDDCVFVAKDRYSGTYSGAKWLAYGWLDDDYGIDGDDVSCMNFWHDNKEPVGKGATPAEAVARLWLALQSRKA